MKKKPSEASVKKTESVTTQTSLFQNTPTKLRLNGTVDRIIFHNTENGYTVLRFKPQTEKGVEQEAVVGVGYLVDPQVGSSLQLEGQFVTNPRFGRQFAWEKYEFVMPSSLEGIRHYLGSGMIKGVRERMAARIVEKFGEQTFEILDTHPEALLSIKGISEALLDRIKTAWDEQQGIRQLIVFLQPHGVSTAYAVRIFRYYGQHALSVVNENPYRLAMDIRGIGFKTADVIAQKLGFDISSPLRAQAGLLYMLQKTTDDGHVYFPKDMLIETTSNELDILPELLEGAVESLQLEERIVLEQLDTIIGVFLTRYHHYESKISFYLKRLQNSPKAVRIPNPDHTISEVVKNLGITLAEEQLQAVKQATKAKVMVLTGGPGTGKTTIVNAIIKVFASTKSRILLAAPTGRAAKRLAETTGREASTVHRLLEYSPREDGFMRNESNPLACGLLVVDESSMLDTMLMYHLLKAVPLGATVVFVGDVNQLPSVGPGNVLQDIIISDMVPVVQLIEVFRQASESAIITNAHAINNGEFPNITPPADKLSDFYFIQENDPQMAVERIIRLVRDHIPRRFKLDPIEDVQVLTPMHKGLVGSSNLNTMLQRALNRNVLAVQRGEREYRLDDKVMQIRNNYDKDVFNGDIGKICSVNKEEREITVRYDERNVLYSFEELDEIVPAYAISIHKSQGSEYPAVVIPLMMQHYMLLQRNLLYTGVTRGKALVIVVGETKAMHMAIKNNRMQKRFTWLAKRLAVGRDVEVIMAKPFIAPKQSTFADMEVTTGSDLPPLEMYDSEFFDGSPSTLNDIFTDTSTDTLNDTLNHNSGEMDPSITDWPEYPEQ